VKAISLFPFKWSSAIVLVSAIFSFLLLETYLFGQQCDPPPSGLVSWWRAEGTGADAVGANHGTLFNSVAFTPGEVNQSFDLDGVSAHVRVPDSPSLRLTNAITIEGWIYPTAVGGAYHDIFSKWDIIAFQDQRSYGTGIVPDGTFAFTLCPFGTTTTIVIYSPNVVPANQWTHFVDTYDGSSVKIYLNGVLQTEAAYNLGIFPGNSAVGIGASVGQGAPGQFISPFKGKIDEISVYNRALTPDEVQMLYNAGAAGKCFVPRCVPPPSGLVSWWSAESTGVDTVGTNNGSLINSVAFNAGMVGQSFDLDGVSAHVRIPDSPNLHFTNAMSIEGWIFPTAVGGAYHDIFTKWDMIPFRDQRCYGTGIVPNGTFAFTLCPIGTTTTIVIYSTNAIPANQWTHFVDTYDGSSVKIYLNGSLQTQAAYNLGIFPGNSEVGIGASVGQGAPGQFISPFQGKIDEISVYNRALTPGEVQALYTAGILGKCFAPVLNIASAAQTVVLSWPASAADFGLLEAADLLGPSAWIRISPTFATNNGQISVTLPVSDQNKFYRLVHP
jgi:hypothetical protein